MSKIFWENGGALLAPVPPVLVSCGTIEKPNIITIGWTGIINTKPPMTYISVRPTRYSYNLIKETGEFAINLTVSSMCKKVDFCGVRSGADVNKFEKCGFHAVESTKISAPIIEECPINLECKVTDINSLGSHDMFLAKIVGVNVNEKYVDSKGKLNIEQMGLMAYAHGDYFSLGRKLGTFGFSVKKKKKISKNISKNTERKLTN